MNRSSASSWSRQTSGNRGEIRTLASPAIRVSGWAKTLVGRLQIDRALLTVFQMNERRNACLLLLAGALSFLSAGTAKADAVFYTVPQTDLTFLLMGKATVNPGGTVTFRHPRGTLYFGARDCRIVKTKTKQRLYLADKLKAKKAGTTDAHLDHALWCVEGGMLEQADQALSAAWKADPQDERVKLMIQLVKYRRGSVPISPSVEKEMREFVKNDDMEFTRSRHFLLMHDTPDVKDPKYGKSVAEHRLDLLEQVYDSFYMKYALEGYPLRVPREPMRVVLFDQHADYLNFVKRLSPALKMTAGFYSPEENIAIFYRQKTDEAFQGAAQLVKVLQDLREAMRRTRIAGGGEVIRLAKTLELLIDIDGENQEIEVVTHEATHQLAANSGLLDRERFQVRWAHEGLASYFESPKEATWAGMGAVNEQRLGYYRILERDPEHSTIEFVVTDKIFDYAGSNYSTQAAYGQAWALTHFLMDEHLPELLQFYSKMAVDDFETERNDAWRTKTMDTFRECFGDLDQLEVEWRKYMRALKTDLELVANAA
jgi:hypothetical protein